MSTTRLTRHIRASPGVVYRALLDPSAVQVWMVPDGMTSRVHEFEAHEGGRFRISLTYDEPDGDGQVDLPDRHLPRSVLSPGARC